MARPALSQEERFSRRAALLDAALRLYREQETFPTVSNIAKAAGIAKGAVYLWFRSKEEIFVAILEDAFLELIARLLSIIEYLDPRPEFAPDSFATQYAKLLAEVPDVVRLSSVLNSMFRENLPIESFSRLDRNVGASLFKAGVLLEQRFGCLMRGKGADLLLHTWTLTIGLWIMMDIPDEMKKVLDDPTLATFRNGFHTEVQDSGRAIMAGGNDSPVSGGAKSCSGKSKWCKSSERTLPMRFLSAVRFVLIFFVLTSCSQGKSGEPPAAKSTPVKTGKVRHAQVREFVSVSGTVVSPDAPVRVAFLVPGKVIQVGPREGDYVKKGQLLAAIDPTDYKLWLQAASAQVGQARIALERTRDEYGRMKFLFESRSLAENDFEKFKAAWLVRQAATGPGSRKRKAP